jgi:hypothetical protein
MADTTPSIAHGPVASPSVRRTAMPAINKEA